MATPTITPMQTPFPDKGQSQAAFDYNVDGLMNLFDSMTTELPIALDWIEDRVNEVAATAIGGDLPDITGQATNMIRLNAAGNAAEFRTPAQVVQDLGSGTAGRAVFAAETPEDGRTALDIPPVIDEDDFATDSEIRPPSQQSTKAYVDANTVGVGQTWNNVTAFRFQSTTYRNTTGKPIMVQITHDSGTAGDIEASSDGSSWVTIGGSRIGGTGLNISFIVPDDHYYRTYGSFTTWSELR